MEKIGGSRLLQMQARFQQRQKETKLVAMYEAQQARAITRLTASSTSNQVDEEVTTTVHRQGKVRQMFEERRSKAGIDKSYPLQPIHGNTERNAPARRATNMAAKKQENAAKHNVKHAVNGVRKLKNDIISNGGGDVNHNAQPHHVTSMPTKNNNRYSEAKARVKSTQSPDTPDYGLAAHESIEDETFPYQLEPPPSARSMPSPPPRGQQPSGVDRKTAPTKTPTKVTRAPVSGNVLSTAKEDNNKSGRLSTRTEAVPAGARESMIKTPNIAAVTKSNIKTPRTPGGVSNAERSAASTTSAAAAAAASTARATGGEPCSVCGRRFASDRLTKHEEICRKANAKKRKPYDALKHRLEGTEAQPFIKQIRKQVDPSKPVSQKSSKPGKQLNSTWRQKHEEFIRAIRAAKTAQAHVAAGGKLSDLPPPPPSENPDYVQCPHCSRRFNQAAAERHIPKCAGYQFNKAKPQSRKR